MNLVLSCQGSIFHQTARFSAACVSSKRCLKWQRTKKRSQTVLIQHFICSTSYSTSYFFSLRQSFLIKASIRYQISCFYFKSVLFPKINEEPHLFSVYLNISRSGSSRLSSDHMAGLIESNGIHDLVAGWI